MWGGRVLHTSCFKPFKEKKTFKIKMASSPQAQRIVTCHYTIHILVAIETTKNNFKAGWSLVGRPPVLLDTVIACFAQNSPTVEPGQIPA
jgi:hypothetical protein